MVENLIRKEGKLRLHSLNPVYEPYDVHVNDVREVWKFVNYISNEMPDPDLPHQELARQVNRLREDVEALKKGEDR